MRGRNVRVARSRVTHGAEPPKYFDFGTSYQLLRFALFRANVPVQLAAVFVDP